MAKRKVKKTTKKTPSAKTKSETPQTGTPTREEVHVIGMITGQILAKMKNIKMNFFDIGELLVKVRNEKLYEDLHHDSLVSYAAEHLHLGHTTLYKYIEVYEYAKKFHPKWLERPLTVTVPDLYDISDLMWIEEQLTKKDLPSVRKTILEKLRDKALAGDLPKRELMELRRKGRGAKGSLDVAIRYLQLAKRQVSNSADPLREAINHIDAAIEILQNKKALAAFGFDLDRGLPAEGCTVFFA
jgi:hypothetical protein